MTSALTTDRPMTGQPHPLEPMIPVLTAAALDDPMPTAVVLGGDGDRAPGQMLHPNAAEGDIVAQLAADGVLVVTDEVAAAPGTEALIAGIVGALIEDLDDERDNDPDDPKLH